MLPAAASAQETVKQTQSLIIPNYSRNRVGKDEALQGGAFIARSGGAAANVYNPAGLASARNTEIAASSTGYEYLKMEIAGMSQSASTVTIAGLGSYFGLVLADPPLPLERWRFGFAIAQPIDWGPPQLAASFPIDDTLPGGDVRYSAVGGLNVTTPTVSAAFAATPRLRFGISLGVPVVSYSQSSTVDIRAATDDSATVGVRDISAIGVAKQLRVSGGVQWEVVPALTLGVVMSSPTWTWTQFGKLSGHRGGYSGTSLMDGWFIDDAAAFNYEQPLEVGGGAALRLGRVELEADLRWYAATSPFELFSSKATGTRTVTDAAGRPSTVTLSFAPTVVRWNDVFNFAAGGHVDLWGRTRVHVGFFTDRSPVGGAPDSIFPDIDFYGGTAGVSFAIGKILSGSVGASYSTGLSDAYRVASTEAAPLATEVKVTIVQFLYSISFSFGGR